MVSFFNKEWVIISLLGLVVILIFAPIFFGGRMIFDDDATQYALPAYKFYADALRTGENAHMVPQILSGFPLFLSYISGLDDPLNYIIFKILDYPLAYFFRIFLDYLLAAIFVFLFCRELGLRQIASLLAAFSFTAAQNITWGLNIINANALPFLPGIFFIVLKVFNARNFFSWRLLLIVLLGIAIFFEGMYGAAAQLNLQSLLITFLFILFLSFRNYKSTGRFSSVWAPAITLFLIFAAGFLLYLPRLLKVLELIPYTIRGGGIPWLEIYQPQAAEMWLRLKGLIYFFFPPTFAVPPYTEGTGLGSIYITAVGFFFFILSFFQRKNHYWYFWAGLFLFAYLSSFPYPLFWLTHKLPIFNLFRNPLSWLFTTSFIMSVLAGIGCDIFWKKEIKKINFYFLVGFFILAVGFILIFLTLHFISDRTLVILNPMIRADLILPALLWLGILGWVFLWVFGSTLNISGKKPLNYVVRSGVKEAGEVSASGVFLLIILFFLGASGVVMPAWIKLLKTSTSLELSSIFKRPWLYETIGGLETAAGNKEPFRTFNFFPGDTQWHLFVKPYNPTAQALANFQREVTRPNLYPLMDNIQSVAGYENLMTSRYKKVHSFLGAFGEESAFNGPEIKQGALFANVSVEKIKLLGMMNVKYIWSSLPLTEKLMPDQIELLRQAVNFPLIIYKNKAFLPRVYSPPTVTILPEDDNNFSKIIGSGPDFKEKGFIECNTCLFADDLKQKPPLLNLKEVHNDSISFKAAGEDDAWVIVANSFMPGWHAYLDGKESPIYHANYIYQGVRVPAGEHEVLLKYER